jgi:predicted nucleotide-binding protein (sugar kinase/HSP70/actin superfamily)
MKTKIGIPRALFYYEFASLWVNFFSELGLEVIISPKTNKKIINDGTIAAVDDACIPVKIYHGHVINLRNKVDYLFIPRIMGITKKEYICPKFCGLPEMIKYSVKDLPKLINTKIDLMKKDNLLNQMLEVGYIFINDKKRIVEAYHKAKAIYDYEKSKLKLPLVNKTNNVVIMGHPYVLSDDYLNMNIKAKLKKAGLNYLLPEMFDDDILTKYAKQYNGKVFWYFFHQMIGTCFYLLEQKLVEGIIYLSSFGCGIDSVVAETVERNIRRNCDIPFMLLTIDEHSGEGGFNTRLEAFIDMLKWRKQNENYISPYGNYLYTR